jgi:hypothetical protein
MNTLVRAGQQQCGRLRGGNSHARGSGTRQVIGHRRGIAEETRQS